MQLLKINDFRSNSMVYQKNIGTPGWCTISLPKILLVHEVGVSIVDKKIGKILDNFFKKEI